ncbi:hypothetical protein DFQ28_006133 [Apophysomyces sp. BC1034]|nr:hypothetical protein DFQ30_006095 [Apophysomyces sp. BC1015]KAG0177302.1 hypothetical protein DFQ29_004994 [Apophysomyces sp. BC1021]KAG0187564.1 hypothetical protein DFQ28_006133 [Apophysomyces sp. BC1034]
MDSLLKRFTSVVGTPPPEKKEVDLDQIPPSDLLLDDCHACTSPCDDHRAYPNLDFDQDSDILGSMLPYGRHFMIGTAQSDWPERIEDDTGTLAANLHAIVKDRPTPWRTFITNTSMVTTYSTLPDALDVIVLPDNIIVSNVTPGNAQAFYDAFVAPPLPEQPTHVQEYTTRDLQDMRVHRCPYDSMILICSHKRRDKRCSVTAKILAPEFDHVLRERNVSEGEGGTAVFMVSHVGGHKFAGNVICYTHQGTRGIWYGRVKTCHCEVIVEETILRGKVIKELYRGSMNHSYRNSKCERIRW